MNGSAASPPLLIGAPHDAQGAAVFIEDVAP